jgi:hypothetical protein
MRLLAPATLESVDTEEREERTGVLLQHAAQQVALEEGLGLFAEEVEGSATD